MNRIDLRMTVRRYGRAVAGFLERHLARKCGALIAFLSCLALIAALVTQEYVCAGIGRDGADLRTVDPMNATVSWLFVLANFGLSLVVIGATMLGAVVFRSERGARIVGACALALAGWSLCDLMASAVLTGTILH